MSDLLNRPVKWILFQLTPKPDPVSSIDRNREDKDVNVCSITFYETSKDAEAA